MLIKIKIRRKVELDKINEWGSDERDDDDDNDIIGMNVKDNVRINPVVFEKYVDKKCYENVDIEDKKPKSE